MTDRPNIILLIGENAGRASGCYGDPDAQTPNRDRLASEGCRYDNAFLRVQPLPGHQQPETFHSVSERPH